MKKPVAHVTDHALLRYLERVLKMDPETHRRTIGRKVDLAMEHEGATGVIIDGFTYKLRGRSVTTVVQTCQPDRSGRKVTSRARITRDAE